MSLQCFYRVDAAPPRRRAALLRPAASVLVLLFLVLCLLGRKSAAQPPKFRSVTIQNTEPRRDVDGNVIDAHDGCLHFYAGRYYLYGTAYGKTAGYTINNRFRVYSSADMEHWTFEGELLQSPPDGVYYRPYVAYNQLTRKYVLWYNWYPKLWAGEVGVATSDTPVGPFTIVNTHVELSQAKDHPGDGSLFVDNDNSAYFIYTAIDQHHSIRVERLAPDFLSSTGLVSGVLGVGCEAPSIFRRGSSYYALFDTTCCFCTEGSGARVLVASNPMGPYRELANINRDASGKTTIPAQQTFVATIETADGPAYLWMGDEWNSRPDGTKGHDLQYWGPPLRFAPDGSILPLEKTRNWTVQAALGQPRTERSGRYVWPQKVDPNPIRTDACFGTPLNERGEPVAAK
ncbi:MAG: family 43 glycosylhydrolase [Terracidiphilus sp.]|nr:family 43 glycosylhydrolase [Terracidiphilus sp.]